MFWAMFCREILGPGIHVDVKLTCATFLNIVVDQAHPFSATVFPDGSGLFHQDNAPCHTAQIVREWSTEHVGCAQTTSLTHRASTSQLAGLAGSAANVLEPDTTRNLVF